MIPWITRNLIYYPIVTLRGEYVRRCLKEVHAFHGLSFADMQEVQRTKLKDLLKYVYRSNKYYRNVLDRQGIDVDRVDDPGVFRRIPLLTKDEIRAHSNTMRSSGSMRVSARRTSGSTGIPLNLVKDREASAYMEAVVYEVYGWHGISIGDRQGRIWAMPLDLKKNALTRLKDVLLNRKRLSSHAITEESCLEYYHNLMRFRPKFVYGLASTISQFVRIVKHHGLNPADLNLSVVIITGEILFPELRQLVETAFACPVVNEYGTTENGIIAFECPSKRMHLMIHNLYLELLNPVDGTPAQPGEIGEVVLTELHARALPFIRYRLGDTVTLSHDTQCECGSELPIVDHVEGRVLDLLIAPDGRRVSTSITSQLMTEGIHRYKVFQKDITRFDILIERMQDCSSSDIDNVVRNFQKFFGDQIIVNIDIVDHIPPDKTGKLRSFVSELSPEKKYGL